MYSTGIPPHIAILSEMSSLQSAMNSQPQVLLDGVSQILQDKGATAGNITLLNRSTSTRKNRSKRPGQQHVTTLLREIKRKKRDLHSSMSAASQSLSQDVSSDQPEPTVHHNDEVEVSGSPTSTPHHSLESLATLAASI
jgi:hypothetical protein